MPQVIERENISDVEFTEFRELIENKINNLLEQFESKVQGKAILILNETFNRVELNAVIINEGQET